jgi:hypothetical protein
MIGWHAAESTGVAACLFRVAVEIATGGDSQAQRQR